MTFRAMGFMRIVGGRRLPSQDVCPIVYCFKVFGVYTRMIAAKMVYHKPFWNWPYQEFIGDSVSPCYFPCCESKSPVSIYR